MSGALIGGGIAAVGAIGGGIMGNKAAGEAADAQEAAAQLQYEASLPKSSSSRGVMGRTNFNADTGRMSGGLTYADRTANRAYGNMIRADSRGRPGDLAAQHAGASASNFLGQDFSAMHGQQYNPNMLAGYMGAGQDAYGQVAAQQGMIGANAYGAQGQGQHMMGAGNRLMAGAENYGQFQQDRLALMREQAAPQEQKAMNSMMQKMFSMGQLGSEGGRQGMQAFGQAQAQADQQRILDSQNQAQQMRMQDLNMGRGMAGQGMQGLAQANQGFGRVASLAGQREDLAGNMLRQGLGFEELTNQRAQRRLQQTQQMMGFGNQALEGRLNRIGTASSARMAQKGDLRQTMALSNSMMKGNPYNPNPVQNFGSPLGSALSSAGTSMLNSTLPSIMDMFGGGGTGSTGSGYVDPNAGNSMTSMMPNTSFIGGSY